MMGRVIKDAREKMANQLLMRGHASVDELLHASFGEWPPKGLDIVHKNTHRVTLTTSEKGAVSWPARILRLFTVCGSASMNFSRTVFINRFLTPFSGGTLITLAHETSHILQGDHGYRARHRTGREGVKAINAAGNITSAQLAHNTLTPHVKTGFLSKAFNLVAAAAGQNLPYLLMGEELQARLQEALTHGYPHWKRLPQNKDEFYFAMRSLGFKMTPHIQAQLDAHPQRAEKERLFPPTPHGLLPSCVLEIQYVQSRLTRQGGNAMWDSTMCGLYCDLIEMYGDRQGRERFGYGPNETHILTERYKTDIESLRAITWQHTRDTNGTSHACTSIAHLSEDEISRLQAAATNAYLKNGVMRTDNGAWLIIGGQQIRGEDSLETLRRLTGQAIVPHRDGTPSRPAPRHF